MYAQTVIDQQTVVGSEVIQKLLFSPSVCMFRAFVKTKSDLLAQRDSHWRCWWGHRNKNFLKFAKGRNQNIAVPWKHVPGVLVDLPLPKGKSCSWFAGCICGNLDACAALPEMKAECTHSPGVNMHKITGEKDPSSVFDFAPVPICFHAWQRYPNKLQFKRPEEFWLSTQIKTV